MKKNYFILAVFSFLGIMCGGNEPSEIKIENQWVRVSSEGRNTAFYFDAVNTGGGDTLIEVSSDIAEIVEIHETFEEGDMMGMRKVDAVPISANSTFNFKPGSHHVMLIKLKRDLQPGEEINFTLHFSRGGEIELTAPVRQK